MRPIKGRQAGNVGKSVVYEVYEGQFALLNPIAAPILLAVFVAAVPTA
jgi:hypothetical protein